VTQRGDYEVSQLRPARYIGPDGVSVIMKIKENLYTEKQSFYLKWIIKISPAISHSGCQSILNAPGYRTGNLHGNTHTLYTLVL